MKCLSIAIYPALKFKIQILLMETLRRLLLLTLLLSTVACFQNCSTNNTATGCQTCNTLNWRVYNTSENKYTCTLVENCSVVENEACIRCAYGLVYNSSTNMCDISNSTGCISFQNSVCKSCDESAYFFANNSCHPKKISYCIKYNQNRSNPIECSECQYTYMNAQMNCSVNSSLCAEFDYVQWKCIKCPNSTIPIQNGEICIVATEHCLQYNANHKCQICDEDYSLINDNCEQSYSHKIQGQYLTDEGATLKSICLLNQFYFNSSSSLCVKVPTSDIDHCQNFTNNTCYTCIAGYYLAEGQCLECMMAMSNCQVCSNLNQCLACSWGYYLLPESLTQDNISQCLTCSSYGCKECVSEFKNGITVLCLSCHTNGTLSQGVCYVCEQQNQSYSVQEAKCRSCEDNCRYCSFSVSVDGLNSTCLWCTDDYYLNASGSCAQINDSVAPTLDNAYELLSKSAPGISVQIFNNPRLLFSICSNTNGFICECESSGEKTSLCSDFTHSINVSQLNADTLSKVVKYANELRMASEFPTFSSSRLATLFTNSELLVDIKTYWNILSIYTQSLLRLPTAQNRSSLLKNLYSHLTNKMIDVFSTQSATIITGNGFYYKFVPENVSDTGYIHSQSRTGWVLYYIWYDRIPDNNALTGHITVYNSKSIELITSVQRKGYISSSSGFQKTKNSANESTSGTTFKNGYIVISNVASSFNTTVNTYQISSTSKISDPYNKYRIESIIYNEALLYILFFIMLYLVFVPLCSIVDCCDQHDIHQRKRVQLPQDDGASQPKSSQEQSTAIRVNYMDFFPLYNVWNTRRPHRLLKLCLFIVNLQHGITFLTLIYFNLELNSDIDVVIVMLALPSYLCTVVAGYLCGLMFVKLPGKFKYFVNLISLGYWFMWFFLMKQFLKVEYKIYVILFAVVFFFVDMIIDTLETLLMYFAVGQKQKDSRLFSCLAHWLSYRGYYEFKRLTMDSDSE